MLYEPLISDVIGTGPKKMLTAIWVILVALVMVSRMYLGAHSLDQVIFGGLVGLSCLIAYKVFLQKEIYRSIEDCLKRKQEYADFLPVAFNFWIYLTLNILNY